MLSVFVSFVIPFHNSRDYLKRSICSCLEQGDVEVLAIDDCSDDGSADIAADLASRDRRLRIFRNARNMGPLYSRFGYLSECRGKYVCFVDSDDFIDPGLCDEIKALDMSFPSYEAPSSCCDPSLACHHPISSVEYDLLTPAVRVHSLALSGSTSIPSGGSNSGGSLDPDSSFCARPDFFVFGIRFHPSTVLRVSPPLLDDACAGGEILCNMFGMQTPPIHLFGKAYDLEFLKDVLRSHENLLLQEIYMAEDVLASFLIALHANRIARIPKKLYNYSDSISSITRDRSPDRLHVKISDINRVIASLESIPDPRSYVVEAKRRAVGMLLSVIHLERRFTDGYMTSVLRSLRHHRKVKNYVRLFLYAVSLGMVKI